MCRYLCHDLRQTECTLAKLNKNAAAGNPELCPVISAQELDRAGELLSFSKRRRVQPSTEILVIYFNASTNHRNSLTPRMHQSGGGRNIIGVGALCVMCSCEKQGIGG